MTGWKGCWLAVLLLRGTVLFASKQEGCSSLFDWLSYIALVRFLKSYWSFLLIQNMPDKKLQMTQGMRQGWKHGESLHKGEIMDIIYRLKVLPLFLLFFISCGLINLAFCQRWTMSWFHILNRQKKQPMSTNKAGPGPQTLAYSATTGHGCVRQPSVSEV